MEIEDSEKKEVDNFIKYLFVIEKIIDSSRNPNTER